MKCYWVGYEDEGAYVFADTANRARYRGRFDGIDYRALRALRAKELDHCATAGIVTQRDALDAYGRTWCAKCYKQAYEDDLVAISDDLYCPECATAPDETTPTGASSKSAPNSIVNHPRHGRGGEGWYR